MTNFAFKYELIYFFFTYLLLTYLLTYFTSQNWVVIKKTVFSLKPLMLKLTKIDTERLKLSFAMFEDTVKI